MTPENAEETCRNCGAPLQGTFCHQCGQSSSVIRRPTREVLDDALGNVFHWDSRLANTLRLLFFHPGRLSLEWMEGRRVRYVPPFRLYIIASFILFLLVGLSTNQGSGEFQVLSDNSSAHEGLQKAIDSAKAEGDWLTGIFLEGTLEALKDPAAYVRKITTNLPKAAFLLLPLFALLHMAVNLRHDRYYIDYLVFSLNFHAFSFALISLVILFGLVFPFLKSILGLLYLVIPVYGIIGLRNFGQQGWGKTLLKGFIVYNGYGTILVFGLVCFFTAILFL